MGEAGFNGNSGGTAERRDSTVTQPLLECPQCGSDRIWKCGSRYNKDERKIQRYECPGCGHRFSETTAKRSDISERDQSLQMKGLSGSESISSTMSVRLGSPGEKLIRSGQLMTKSRTVERAAGATVKPADLKGTIIDYAWWMKKQGYAESTITERTKLLRIMVKRGANLFDPESVKEVIARQETWSEGRKELAVEAYTNYLLMAGGTWNPPRYRRVEKLPFIPTEAEIDQLISGCGQKTATFLQLLKETGARASEAWNLEWIDIDYTSKIVRITPKKRSNPRVLRISDKLLAMLSMLPKKPDKVFGAYPLRGFRRPFQRQRKRIAQKIGNPRIARITFHTLRHWKATMEYYKTKDILHVMKLLGHKNIKNTLIYTQLVNFENEDDYVCKTATTVQEARELIEVGFEYICEIEATKLFRKRK